MQHIDATDKSYFVEVHVDAGDDDQTLHLDALGGAFGVFGWAAVVEKRGTSQQEKRNANFRILGKGEDLVLLSLPLSLDLVFENLR
jgi:hypothetical protein